MSEIRIPESGGFLLVESAILGFEIRETAQGIRNPSSTDKESGIHGWNPEFKTVLKDLLR